jgi:SnoaL-like domain
VEVWHDVAEIRAVLDAYATGIDRRDFEMVRRCFTEDCDADYGRAGSWTAREPFVTWLDEIHRDVGPTMHRITNHDVQVDATTASATCYFDALLRVEHRGFDLLHVVGSYRDDLVRGDGWRIRSRRTENYLWRREHA